MVSSVSLERSSVLTEKSLPSAQSPIVSALSSIKQIGANISAGKFMIRAAIFSLSFSTAHALQNGIVATMDKMPLGAVSACKSQFNATFDTYPPSSTVDHLWIVEDPTNSSNPVLRVTLAPNAVGSSEGTSFNSPLNVKCLHGVLSYRLYFEGECGEGGKFSGLAGPNTPSGCEEGNTDWSARFMWRDDDSVEPSATKCVFDGYGYFPLKNDNCGAYYYTNHTFSTGLWHEIKQEVVIGNTDPQTNETRGSIYAWLDGNFVMNQTDTLLGTQGIPYISYAMISYFRGGKEDYWQSPNVTYIYSDDYLFTCLDENQNNQITTKESSTLPEKEENVGKTYLRGGNRSLLN